jgi:hypothetical protein
LNAISSSEPAADEERVLVKFDMARALWPGTLEYKISAALRDVPPTVQMPLLMYPEFVAERAKKRHSLWTGIAGLILSLSMTPFFALGMALHEVGITPKGILFSIAMAIAVFGPAFLMFRWGTKAKRISRCAERFAEIKKENGLRLAFEWTAPRSLSLDR